ncbi:MAG: hypothetical protein IAE84_16765 [Saprospiraceae bacterium]|nr:hypothetical protein [Saprospiraceae bacterium]
MLRLPCVLLIYAFALAPVSSLRGQSAEQKVIRSILDKICAVYMGGEVKKIEINLRKGTLHPASYWNSNITIKHELYEMCRSFGADSLNALAFVIGHEFVHSTQVGTVSIPFNASRVCNNDNEYCHKEREADVEGLFLAYLAGYGNYKALLPVFMDSLYGRFGIDRDNEDYPHLDERKKTTEETLRKVDLLIQLYEAATQLIAIDEYDYAETCLSYVEKYYGGYEVKNSLGVCQMMKIIDLEEREKAFPFEISAKLRLAGISRDRPELKEYEKKERDTLILRAEGYLNKAHEISGGNAGVVVNLQCLDILKGQPEKVLEIDVEEVSIKQSLVKALAHFYSNESEEAIKLWNEVAQKGGIYAKHAELNLKKDDESSAPCALIEMKSYRPDNGKKAPEIELTDDIGISIVQEAGAYIYYLFDQNNLRLTFRSSSLPLDTFPGKLPQPNIFTEKGSMVHCPIEKMLIHFDSEGNASNWVQYWKD